MAGIRIFETDPDAMPRKRTDYSDDTVGSFHSGMKDANGDAMSLAEWRLTTAHQSVADTVAGLLGGEAVDTDSASENHIEVLTTSPSVRVVLSGTDAVHADMKLWNGNTLVHHCDGVEYLSPDEDRGNPCGCPRLVAERKALAKKKLGPSPSIELRFRLADDYDLGEFKFKTGAWTLADILHEIGNDLDAIDGPALADLFLELVEYTTKAGRAVSYRKPVIRVLKAYNDAIADER